MLKVYTDAATNTEKSGGGILIISEEQKQVSISLTETNNHQAELAVILYALNYLIDHKLNDQTILLYSDSKTAIKILDQRQTKNKLFLPYLSEFNELASQFPLLVLQWIPEAKNKGADNLARQGLRKKL
ncbi:ribonuclease HI family protein [Enterococcus sp.]|uniref:ribonuclease HI family protein n=1 Tax=Enterococcus sp. TaxID=35783 RepID=UPI00290C8E84|nr:ribonuclease HI family protein [Enterococcus sp.]MDU5335901.1 ribonuclease HI family protein [Enterococcus sp.]